MGVGHEAGGRQSGLPVVAACQAGSGDVEFTGDTDRDEAQQSVADGEVGLGHGGADGRGADEAGVQGGADARGDGDLGRPVGVEQAAAGCPAAYQVRGEGFAAGGEDGQVGQSRSVGGDAREDRGRDQGVGEAVKAAMPRWVTRTPLGRPVEPEV